MTLAAAFTSGLLIGCICTLAVGVAVGAAIGSAVTWDRPRDVPDFVPAARSVTW